ncbi:MAG: hypothetical protein IJ395_08555 [Clostridia bacterium]|nr:hypothetical protein [Clostridia bacterium]
MAKIMFVCHGNICRSPMAEFIFKDMIKRKGLEGDFFVASTAATALISEPMPDFSRSEKVIVFVCSL